MADQSRYEQFFGELPIVKTLREEEAAKKAAEDAVKELQEREKDLRAKISGINERIKEEEKELSRLKSGCRHTQDEMVAMLGEKRDEADDTCSELVMKLNTGEMTAMEFAREFRKVRLLYHVRNAKIESAARGTMTFGN